MTGALFSLAATTGFAIVRQHGVQSKADTPRMNIVVVKPYRFVPPHHGESWPKLFRYYLPTYLRKAHGVVAVQAHGGERLRASLAAGHGIMLAPNHCRPCDPMVLGQVVGAFGRAPYILASWHLFMERRLQAFLLPRLGVFSIYREGLDRDALKCAIQVLAAARRPLIVFPEGVISRHNDRLNHLMEGTALMLRGAARQRAAAHPPGKVVVHPVAIRYFFDGDAEAEIKPVLADIEKRLAWQPQDQLPPVERIAKVGSALLVLKELEFFGVPQSGTLAERLQRLIDRMLGPLDDEWLKGRHEPDIVARVKLLRTAMLPDMITGELTEAEMQRRWRQLSVIYLAQQIAFYPPGYFTAPPTRERMLEIVEKFEEDLTDVCRVHAPLHAVVEIGEALTVEPERARGGEGDPLMNTLRERMEALLAAALAEGRPPAALP